MKAFCQETMEELIDEFNLGKKKKIKKIETSETNEEIKEPEGIQQTQILNQKSV